MLLLILEREEGREKNNDMREKHCSVASHMLPDWGLNCNPDMCPQRCGIQDDASTN